MSIEVVLPRLGWNMETGRVGEWLKKNGERVEVGELLFTVEGDKATQEIEALDAGILHIPADLPPPGTELPVGTVLAYLLQPGEREVSGPGTKPAPEVIRTGTTSSAAPSAGSASFAQATEPARAPGAAAPSISPRARRVAGELGVEWQSLKGSGRTGRIVERDVRGSSKLTAPSPGAFAPSTTERVSPLARRLAVELGVDVDALAGSLPGRRIERADVEAAAVAQRLERPTPPPVPTLPAPTAPKPLVGGRSLPISSIRRTIADRLARSAHTVAPVTLTTEADATELVQLRRQLKEDGVQPVPTYNDLLARLVSQALVEHPMVNAHFDGESIVQAETINIGIAVDTDRGLLVPVLRDVQRKSLRQIAGESSLLIEQARTGRISPDDLQGGTFTITNLGMFDIDAFTPIINLPECAILGVGRIVAKQVVVDPETEKLAIRQMLWLSLTFDHRLVDGAPAARFLQRVKQFVSKPYLWLVG